MFSFLLVAALCFTPPSFNCSLHPVVAYEIASALFTQNPKAIQIFDIKINQIKEVSTITAVVYEEQVFFTVLMRAAMDNHVVNGRYVAYPMQSHVFVMMKNNVVVAMYGTPPTAYADSYDIIGEI